MSYACCLINVRRQCDRSFRDSPFDFRVSTFDLRDCLSSFPGGHGGGVPPVPIPNTVVKPSCADDTAGVTLWESRSLPGVIKRKALQGKLWRAFLLPCRGPAGRFLRLPLSSRSRAGPHIRTKYAPVRRPRDFAVCIKNRLGRGRETSPRGRSIALHLPDLCRPALR